MVSGGSSAVLGVTLRLLFAQFMGYTASVIVSYFFSTLAAYALNKRLVFRGQARSTELGKFFVVNVIGLLQTTLLSNAFFKLIEWTTLLSVPLAETLGHAGALSTLAVTSFIIHKYWTFSESKPDGEARRPD
nr:GtrA family protein [Stenotrophomonas tumulicola]